MVVRSDRAAYCCILLLAGSSAGCSTAATISRYSGPDIDGRITGGGPDAIVVEDDSGISYAIPRRDVREIDHPGNVVAILGGVQAAYGVLNIAVGLSRCRDDANFASEAEQSGFCTGIFLPVVVGASMMVWGLIVHQRSSGAAKDTSLPPSMTQALPVPYQWQHVTEYGPGPGPYPSQPSSSR